MKLIPSDGRVVVKKYDPKTKMRIELPDNVSMEDVPTFEIVSVGQGRQSPNTGQREFIPFQPGDRVLIPNVKVMPIEIEGEKQFTVDWTHILAKVTE